MFHKSWYFPYLFFAHDIFLIEMFYVLFSIKIIHIYSYENGRKTTQFSIRMEHVWVSACACVKSMTWQRSLWETNRTFSWHLAIIIYDNKSENLFTLIRNSSLSELARHTCWSYLPKSVHINHTFHIKMAKGIPSSACSMQITKLD